MQSFLFLTIPPLPYKEELSIKNRGEGGSALSNPHKSNRNQQIQVNENDFVLLNSRCKIIRCIFIKYKVLIFNFSKVKVFVLSKKVSALNRTDIKIWYLYGSDTETWFLLQTTPLTSWPQKLGKKIRRQFSFSFIDAKKNFNFLHGLAHTSSWMCT